MNVMHLTPRAGWVCLISSKIREERDKGRGGGGILTKDKIHVILTKTNKAAS